MLSFKSQMTGTTLRGLDESVGSIHDVLFDTESWTIRHLVIDTGKWFPGRRVLLPPDLITQPDWPAGTAAVQLTRDQVKESPSVDSDRPVSRQMEMDLYSHFNVPYYWGPAGATLSGSGMTPMPLGASASSIAERQETAETDSPHLRSAKEVIDYYIKATDDEIGHVEDLIINNENWDVRYLVVDTRNWLPGRKVLVAREWIEDLSWHESTVAVGLTKDEIKNSPEYDRAMTIDRQYEERLYDHYGREGYWTL